GRENDKSAVAADGCGVRGEVHVNCKRAVIVTNERVLSRQAIIKDHLKRQAAGNFRSRGSIQNESSVTADNWWIYETQTGIYISSGGRGNTRNMADQAHLAGRTILQKDIRVAGSARLS